MLGPLGMQEMLVILGLALLIFGPRKLPEMGRTLGRALGEFRRATTDLKRSVQVEMDAEDDRQRSEREAAERRQRETEREAEAKALPSSPSEASAAETAETKEPESTPAAEVEPASSRS